jgi:ubiquinone/menaquinone biosynthesis C-methylase UbiE
MTHAIELRYGALAESTCCLSCGSAVRYVMAAPGEVCVDLGSGRGADVLRLAQLVAPGGHAYGIDIADEMHDKARRNAAKLGIRNATFLRANLIEIPLREASVDWITSNCVLNHVADKRAIWREIARILKPGGRFVVSDIYAVEPIPEIYSRDPEAIAECWAGAVLKRDYLAAIEAAGFVDIQILEESMPYQKGKATIASFTLAGARPSASLPAPRTARGRCCS